jgi:hypothetical protein
MLPTPTAMDSTNATATMKSSQVKEGPMHSVTLNRAMSMGMLPTPIASDIHHAERVQKLKELGAQTMASRKNGANRPNGLMDYMDFNGMLPTPATRDYKGARSEEALELAGRNQTNSLPDAFAQHGTTSQLNPPFVLEMMGIPTNHCDNTLLQLATEIYQKTLSQKSAKKHSQNGETKQ